MDFVKTEADADDETGMASADECCDQIDMKEEVDSILITFPSVKSENEVSCVFLGTNIS
jgi:hypothetical protein